MTDTVVIGSQSYDSYASLTVADLYADAAFHADTWRALDDEDKARSLVTVTRLLDRQLWKEDYNTFALRAAETNIVNAAIELAIALVDGSEIQNVQTSVERVRSMSAGSVSITFRGGVDFYLTRFPQIVHELLRDYLAGLGEAALSMKVTGVDTLTSFPTTGLGLSKGI